MNKSFAEQLKKYAENNNSRFDINSGRAIGKTQLREMIVGKPEVVGMSYPGADGIGADFEVLEKRVMADFVDKMQ